MADSSNDKKSTRQDQHPKVDSSKVIITKPRMVSENFSKKTSVKSPKSRDGGSKKKGS